MSRKMTAKHGSVQALLGMQRFTDHGIMTADGELVFFRVQPTNISVLSPYAILKKADDLTKLLNLQQAVEIVCCDAQQNFTPNKLYLKRRMTEETTPEIKELLAKDERFMNNVQAGMASSREFFFVLRLKKQEGNAAIAQFGKLLDQHSFYPYRLSKDELKGLIARYFGYYSEIPLPDYDGA